MRRIRWRSFCWQSAILGFIAVAPALGVDKWEPVPGVTIFNCFPDLKGELLFVLGRCPTPADRELPPASVIACDLETKVTTNVLALRRAGELADTLDGKWIVVTESSEMLAVSRKTREQIRVKFSSDEIRAVVLGDRAYVQAGPLDRRRIEVCDLHSGLKTSLTLGVEPMSTMNWDLLALKRADPNHVFVGAMVGFSPVARGSGLYAYDPERGKLDKVTTVTEFHDSSVTGDAVCWEPVESRWLPGAWNLVVRNESEPTKYPPRNLCRFSDAFNFKQVSPCLRYALIEGATFDFRGGTQTYYLCDLVTGKKKLFLEAKPWKHQKGGFIGEVHWVKKAGQVSSPM